MARDYYAILGVSATADRRQILRAYRTLARRYSPDVNLWDRQAQALFEEIAAAYRVLADPVARAMYDRLGASGERGALAAGRRGEDLHAAIELSFAEAARGVRRNFSVDRFSACGRCGATGADGEHACGACRGRGVRRSRDVVVVELPAGVDSGTEVRVPGEGNAGPFGGPRGDLIVSTRVQAHPFFERRGHNLHCEVPISVWEALRGARIRVPTPAGEAVVVVPPGTKGGLIFPLRGHGLPRLASDGVGDLYVTVRVEMPAGLDARTDELVRELERLCPMQPRQMLQRYWGGAV